jgi:hypothetical protein
MYTSKDQGFFNEARIKIKNSKDFYPLKQE